MLDAVNDVVKHRLAGVFVQNFMAQLGIVVRSELAVALLAQHIHQACAAFAE